MKNKNKESVFKRMARGFKVMYWKIVNSDYVQSIKEEQEKADPHEFYPVMPENFKNDEIDNYQWETDFKMRLK